jgi:hypothetical protein
MEASSVGGLGPEGAVTSWMDGKENTHVLFGCTGMCICARVHEFHFAACIEILCKMFYIQQII